MNIIRKEPNPSGAYPAPQSWDNNEIPEGYVIIADTVDMSAFYEYNGFVTMTIEEVEVGTDVTINEDGEEVNEPIYTDAVTSYVPNIEAWEEWKASLPDPSETEETPTQLDRIEAQVTYTAMMTDTLLEEE